MVRIAVVSIDGKPPVAELVADFDELGGSIGRDAGCTLVLPDLNRRISRRHASVVLRDGRYVLCDHGTAMPVLVNGRPVGSEREVPLADGDRVEIGGYAMEVTMLPATPSRREQPRPPAREGEPAGAEGSDLLSAFGAPQPSHDPFADLAPGPAPGARPAPAAETPPSRVEVRMEPEAVIPADFDPFAEPPPPARPAVPPRPTDALGLELEPPGKGGSIDELFGLTPERRQMPFPRGHPLAPESEGAESLEELLSPRQRPASGQTPQRDDVAELHGSMRLPEEAKRPAPEVPPDVVVSWEQPQGGDGAKLESVVIPSPPQRAPHDAQAPEPRVEVHLDIGAPAPRMREPEAPRATHAAPGAPGSPDALLAAFLEGAGVPELPLRGPLTPEFMRFLGALLRTATQGTLDLLKSRTAVKSGLHAHVTVITSRENNPLKFSPTVEAALYHLLAPEGRGFMPPARAMEEAYQDLVSHQLGTAAGMRAALAGVLALFDPAELEKKLTDSSVIDAIMPSHRRAKLWELFAERFAELSGEAEDDFDRVFGGEFLKAYEAQVAEVRKRGGSGDH